MLGIAALWGALALLCAQASFAHAGEACPKRRGDHFWVVSTRHLPDVCGVSAAAPDFRLRFYSQGTWHTSDAAAFYATDDSALPTVFYIHGNRYEDSDAIERGWMLYRALTKCLSPEQHVRFVVWSWPSQRQQARVLQDARAKACRSNVEAYYFARFAADIDPDAPLRGVGYSLGARVLVGGVHLVAGGELAGRVLLQRPSADDLRFRLALLAAGVEDDAFLPGAKFQMTLTQTEALLNIYNRCDPALKRYRFVDPCERPSAMGYSGIAGRAQLGAASERIAERSAASIVGRSHDEELYFGSAALMNEVRAVVLP